MTAAERCWIVVRKEQRARARAFAAPARKSHTTAAAACRRAIRRSRQEPNLAAAKPSSAPPARRVHRADGEVGEQTHSLHLSLRAQLAATECADSAATELGGRRFGAEEAPKKPGHRWAVSRQMIEPGQGPPRSQPETRVPLRPDAIDRTVRLTARALPPLSTETRPPSVRPVPSLATTTQRTGRPRVCPWRATSRLAS